MRVALVLSVLLLTGCVRPGADAPAQPNQTLQAAALVAPGAAATGAIQLLARMPDGTLLADVNATIANASRSTGADGIAVFPSLAPGHYDITAKKTSHRTAQLAADVVAGQTTRVEAVLPVDDGANHAHAGGVFAHHDIYKFHGHFDCSATYIIVTGDCVALVTNVSEQTGAPDPTNALTNESYLIPFAVDRNWTSFVAELAWSASVPTDATGQRMTIAFEPAESPKDGHSAKYAYAEGASPLRVQLDAGKPAPGATSGDMPKPEGGEVLRARAYIAGAAHHPAGAPLLGVGADVKQDFDLYVTVFYGEAVPHSYSAMR